MTPLPHIATHTPDAGAPGPSHLGTRETKPDGTPAAKCFLSFDAFNAEAL